MNKKHELFMSTKAYPHGLRIIECGECKYAFFVEVDQSGTIRLETRTEINAGDQLASHSFFQTPLVELDFDMPEDIEVRQTGESAKDS